MRLDTRRPEGTRGSARVTVGGAAKRRSTLARAARAAWRAPRWSWVTPALAASAMAVAYLVIDPRTGDLPAHLFRAELFDREGFTIWSNAWYGGHHVPAYSVLFPPLAWLIGPRAVGAVACVGAAILFERIVCARYGDGARFGALWFGVGVGSLLFTERLTFALGVAVGLAAVLALGRGRPWVAAVLGAGASLASPVAGLFVALAGAASGLAEWRSSSERRPVLAGLGLAGAALAPILALALLFPEHGPFPFDLSAYVAVPLFAVAALILLPRAERTLRTGVVLYLLGATAAFLLETGAGGNVARLGSLFAGPVLAAALVGRGAVRRGAGIRAAGSRGAARRSVLVIGIALLALAYWQWVPAVRATLPLHADPSTTRAYYEPLLERLEERPPAGRLEIPFLASHFETAHVAERFPLARGWERQLDIERNPLFYEGELEAGEYARWLRQNGVSHVALAAAPNDYGGQEERHLVEEEPGYLRPVWESADWRLYAVRRTRPIATPEAGADVALRALGDSSFTLRFRSPGAALVRVRWTPYWLAEGACVEPAGEWTRVTATEPGTVRVTASFALDRVGSDARRCG